MGFVRFGSVNVDLGRFELHGAKEALAQVGKELAEAVRQRIFSGEQVDGTAIPAPLDGGRPFVRSGLFVRSIRFRRTSSKGGGYVFPAGLRERVKSKAHARALAAGTSIGGRRRSGRARGRLARSNADLARLYLARKYWHRSAQSVVLMGATDSDIERGQRILAGKLRLKIRARQR